MSQPVLSGHGATSQIPEIMVLRVLLEVAARLPVYA